MNKAFIQKSKTIKFKILLFCVCTAFISAWFLAFSNYKKSELEILWGCGS